MTNKRRGSFVQNAWQFCLKRVAVLSELYEGTCRAILIITKIIRERAKNLWGFLASLREEEEAKKSRLVKRTLNVWKALHYLGHPYEETC
jgi:hypothetical protein